MSDYESPTRRYKEAKEKESDIKHFRYSDDLEVAVYMVGKLDQKDKETLNKNVVNGVSTHNYYIKKKSDDIILPDKIYGKANRLLEHYFKRFDSTNTSLEVMLVGDAGSGKTLLSDMICAQCLERGMPVIDVSGIPLEDDFGNFLKEFQNVCIRIDEFAKLFRWGAQRYLLTLMTERDRRIFWVLTENSYSDVDKLFIGSTHRVRYSQEFTKLETDVIEGFCRDKGVDKAFIGQILSLQRKASKFSFTHLTTLVEEHEMFPNKSLDELLSILNLKHLTIKYMIRVKDVEYRDESVVEEMPRLLDVFLYSSRLDTSSKGYYDFKRVSDVVNSDQHILLAGFDDIRELISDSNSIIASITFTPLREIYQVPNRNNESRRERKYGKKEEKQQQPFQVEQQNNPEQEKIMEDFNAIFRDDEENSPSILTLKDSDNYIYKELKKVTDRVDLTDKEIVLGNDYFTVTLEICTDDGTEVLPISYFVS